MSQKNLGPLEQKVMDCIWRIENVSVRDVYACLKKSRKIAYTTIMTVMTRLTIKGFLLRKKKGKAYIYSPKKSKRQAVKDAVKKMFDSLLEQYGQETVAAFTDELKKRK